MLEKDVRSFWNIFLSAVLTFFFGNIACCISSMLVVIKNGYSVPLRIFAFLVITVTTTLSVWMLRFTYHERCSNLNKVRKELKKCESGPRR